jgi:hypothetical protein
LELLKHAEVLDKLSRRGTSVSFRLCQMGVNAKSRVWRTPGDHERVVAHRHVASPLLADAAGLILSDRLPALAATPLPYGQTLTGYPP